MSNFNARARVSGRWVETKYAPWRHQPSWTRGLDALVLDMRQETVLAEIIMWGERIRWDLNRVTARSVLGVTG